MKPIVLHPTSVLAGLALAGVLVLGVGAAQSHGTVQGIPSHDVRLVGEVPGEWWTYANLFTQADGTILSSFAVPSDRLFVVTLGRGNPPLANGVAVKGWEGVTALFSENHGTRVVVAPGAVLTMAAGSGPGDIWGYLEPF